MDAYLIAIILGIVEGLTEFLPVSSTGHLILVGHLLGFTGDRAASFEVVIQLGAQLAVVVLYWRRFVDLAPGHAETALRSNLSGWSGLARIAVATLPALTVAFFARHAIKEHLFTPATVTWALVVGAIGILIAERYVAKRPKASLETITLGQAFGVGLFQVCALWPGTSRSAATIVGGMVMGLERKGAAEFSFLIAVPVMFCATGYEMLKMRETFVSEDLLFFGTGFVVAFLVALLAIKVFIGFVSRWSLVPFAWYRIGVAAAFYFMTRSMVLQ